MALTKRQKWGIGAVVTAVGLAVVGGFAIANQLAPVVFYTAYGLAVVALGYLGITNVSEPPTPPE